MFLRVVCGRPDSRIRGVCVRGGGANIRIRGGGNGGTRAAWIAGCAARQRRSEAGWQVFTAMNLRNGELLAVKCIDLVNVSREDMDEIQNEVGLGGPAGGGGYGYEREGRGGGGGGGV